jgi:arylsulfatase A-like enzyme
MSNYPLNVLILYTDQQRADAMACAGNGHIYTPNLDRLAAEGVLFTEHYCNCPVSMPSRLSMLSGRYAHNLGILTNGTTVPENIETLPSLLSRQGYFTANIGKLHFVPHANHDYRNPHARYGFDHLEISDEPGPYDDAYRAFIRQRMPDQLKHISRCVDPPAARQWRQIMEIDDGIVHPSHWDPWTPSVFSGRDDATHTAFVGQRTSEFIQSRAACGQPFFCIAGFYSPHSPLVAPARYFDLYEAGELPVPRFPDRHDAARAEQGFCDQRLRAAKHGYYAMVSEVDFWVGRIINTLESAGLAERTLVIFLSDHGEFLGEHLRWGKGRPHDPSSHVPLIVRPPQITEASGRVCSGLVESVDIAPTVLEACGLAVPGWMNGRSLMPVLKSGDPIQRNHVLIEQDDWKAIKSVDHCYVLYRNGQEELFDLNHLLGEYENVAAKPDYSDRLNSMRHALAVHLLQSERPLPREWPY